MSDTNRRVSVTLTFHTPASEHVVLAEVTNHLVPMQAYHLGSAHVYTYEVPAADKAEEPAND